MVHTRNIARRLRSNTISQESRVLPGSQRAECTRFSEVTKGTVESTASSVDCTEVVQQLGTLRIIGTLCQRTLELLGSEVQFPRAR